MTINRKHAQTLFALVAALAASGCVISRPGSTCRIWADCNTLGAPALFIDETDHLPYPAPRVEYFRWMYNAGTLAQRHAGLTHAVGTIAPPAASSPAPGQLLPDPAERPPQSDDQPDSQLPPLPAQTDLPDDQPAPSQTPPSIKRDESDGPTAAANRSNNRSRN